MKTTKHTIINIDKASVINGMAIIQGWLVVKSPAAEILIFDNNRKALPYQIERNIRPDVNQKFELDDGYEAGINILIESAIVNTRYISIVIKQAAGETRTRIDLTGSPFINQLKISARRLKYRLIRTKNQFFRILLKKDIPPVNYDDWARLTQPSKPELRKQQQQAFSYKPVFSIIIPLYNTPIFFLKKLLYSILSQTYQNWELCLADGSTSSEVWEYLNAHYSTDRRIKYCRLNENNGISANTNKALEMAAGDFFLFADHDDMLAPNALYEMAKALNEEPDVDILYTDEDLTDRNGRLFYSPNFKPDFDWELLRGNNYICHIFAVRKSIADKVGLLDQDCDGAQDFDYILKCCEKTSRIKHIPKVLYHWRSHDQSTAGNPDGKKYAYDAGLKAVANHYQRLGINARAEKTDMLGRYRTYWIPQKMSKVSIVLAPAANIPAINACVESILTNTEYSDIEILINVYTNIEGHLKKHPKVTLMEHDTKASLSIIYNACAKAAHGEYLIFLEPSEIVNPHWLNEMLGYIQRNDVGMVTGKLYYSNRTLKSAGYVLGCGDIAELLGNNSPEGDYGYMSKFASTHCISAAPASCLMISKQLYDELGGMDEAYKNTYYDIDLSLKIREKELTIIFYPYAEFRSLFKEDEEAAPVSPAPEDGVLFLSRWKDVINKGDPYFNPNLYKAIETFRGKSYRKE